MSDVHKEESSVGGPTDEDRLDSWKEISTYLRKEVRTVQRWERKEGLPVHRGTGRKRPSIHAYRSEIDSWLAEREKTWSHLNGKSRTSKIKPSRRNVWIASLVIGCVAATVGIAALLSGRSETPTVDFAERDWILITDLENRTSNPIFDGLIENALAMELANSQFANVIPRVRIEDTLRLMRLPLDTQVDLSLGLEISERDGAIRALLASRVDSVGDQYALTLELLDAASQTIVAATDIDDIDDDSVMDAARTLSNWVRDVVGERLPSVNSEEPAMERVTTRSLEALRLYSEALDLSLTDESRRGDWAVIESLVSRALEYDEEFAAAHVLLAHALRNQSRPAEEYLVPAERALALSETISDRERYFVRGSYYTLQREYEQAIREYRALLELYPDDYWAVHNVAPALALLGREDEAALYFARRADLRPNSLEINSYTAQRLLGVAPEEARRFYERAAVLAEEVETFWAVPLRTVRFFPALEAWYRGDSETVLEEAEAIRAALSREAERFAGTRDANLLAELYAAVGQTAAAERWLDAMERPNGASDHRLLLAIARNERVEDVTRFPGSEGLPVMAVLLARSGQVAQAQEALELAKSNRYVTEAVVKVVEGELANALGREADAMELLTDGLQAGDNAPMPPFFLAAGTLAALLERAGDLDGAARILNDWGGVLAKRGLVAAAGGMRLGVQPWLLNRWNLAQLYRRTGNNFAADEIEFELRQLLAYADDDHYVAQQLRQERNADQALVP